MQDKSYVKPVIVSHASAGAFVPLAAAEAAALATAVGIGLGVAMGSNSKGGGDLYPFGRLRTLQKT